MADNLDPEVVAQFQEAMRQATEAAKAMPQAMNATVDAINKATASLKNEAKATSDNTTATEKNTKATGDLTEAEKAKKQADEELLKVQNLQKAALYDAKQALLNFGDALLNGTRGFEKYGRAMNSAGDAALEFGQSLGPLGTVLGTIVKAGTMVASAMAKQADDVLKATDDLSKIGTAGAFSAEQVRKMGTELGLASDQLEKFTKPVKSLGSSLISLGGNAADGVKQFQELAKVTSEQRQQYQRLGISQEEQIQNTADYINLQTQQGRQITEQMKRDNALRNAAREYTDNLLELSALTGKDIEAVKKKNELAMSEIETAIQNNLLDQEINRLRKLDTVESRARADQLDQERKARDKLLQRVENEVGDPALRKGLAKFLATGAITEEVAALKRIGVPIEDFASKIKQGVDVSDQFMDSLSKNGDAMMRNVGTAAMFDENTRKAFGVSSEFMNYLAKARDRDEKAQSDLIKKRIEETKAGTGAAGEDPAQKARNALTEAEIAAKVALDDMVASMNPLLNNFSEMDNKVKLLILSVVAATVAIGTMAAIAGKRAADEMMGKLEGTPLGKTGTLAKVAKVGGGIAAVGMGAVEGYQAYQAGDKAGMGGAAGGTAGALVGGALGSVLGPVGTVLGGMAGQYFGEKVGRWLATDPDKKDPQAGAALSKAELEEKKAYNAKEKFALEYQLQDQTISDAERTLAQIRLRKIQKEEALLLNQEAINEYKAAKTPEEKEAAKAKSDRARATLANLKTEEATYNLQKAVGEQERKDAETALLKAREEAAGVEIWRATQELKSAANEEEKKAAQARLDAAKKALEEEKITIKKNEEIRTAEEELKKATNDEQKKIAEEKIKALKGELDKELEAINKKYNTAEAKPAGQESAIVAPKSGITVRDAPDQSRFAGEFAEGGTIPSGKFGLVGERGPELISGPGQITPFDKLGAAGFDETTEDFIDTFLETDKSVKEFDKELSGFVKDDPAGKMTKQLNLVTTALEDLNELINPTNPQLDITGVGAPKVPSASGIARSVISQISGLLGGTMPSGGGGGGAGSAPVAGPAAPSDTAPTAKPKSGGILGALASAFGLGDAIASEGGKDDGDPVPTSANTALIDDKPKARPAGAPVGNMSEDDIKRMIIRHEGVRYRPYKDSLGLWTVGIGHLIGDGRSLPPNWNREFSKEEVLGLFEKDYEHHRQAAERIPGFDKMNTVGQGALTDLTFNMGPYWINKWPNTRRKLEQGDFQGAADNLEDSKWYTQVGGRAPTITNMVRQGMKADIGGIFDGPRTGYPVEMHGKEMVTRLDPNSLIEKLAKTPATQFENEINKTAQVQSVVSKDDGMKELAEINVQMMQMMSEKLDNMISKLEVSNDTQEKLLKFSQV
jgi:lysozyme